MPDPVTLTVLGSVAAAEGIKFLYGQAAELLKAWRERHHEIEAGEAAPAELSVPIVENSVLDGTPVQHIVDAAVLDRENRALIQLIGALSPYAQGQADIDPADEELSEQAGRVRALLEAAYGQRFTFRGERREPTGTRVSVRQILDDVEGTAIGVDAEVGPGADVDVEQKATTVKSTGSVIGFKGRIG